MRAAGKRKPTLKEQIRLIAEALERSPKTIKTWVREGMDPFDCQSVCRWWGWKDSRRKNVQRPDSIPRRVRSPLD
jgi:hypothetical protein